MNRRRDDGRSMVSVPLPGLSTARRIVDTLCARALLRFGAGDFEGFVTDVMAVKKLARHLARDFAVATTVGLAMDQRANKAIGAAAASGKLTAEQSARLLREMQSLEDMRPAADAVNVGERWCALDAAELLAVGKGSPLKVLYTEGNVLMQVNPQEVNWDRLLRGINRAADDTVAAIHAAETARQPRRRALLEEFEKRAEAAWPEALRDAGLFKKRGETRDAYTARVEGALEEIFLPRPSAAVDLQERTRMVEQMTRTLLRLAAVRARAGAWPETVSDLPADSDGEGTVLYVRGKEGVRLYGIGPNRRDDGGKTGADDPVVGAVDAVPPQGKGR